MNNSLKVQTWDDLNFNEIRGLWLESYIGNPEETNTWLRDLLYLWAYNCA